MKLALTAGGTGGHIFPAFAVLDAFLAQRPETDVRFFGPEDRGERATIEARGIRFESVPSAQVRGRGPLKLFRSGTRLAAGLWIAVRKLRSFRPDVLFSTGGYGSFPSCVAARLLRVPIVVFLPDVSPGWAVRAEKRLATRMATTTEAALEFLPPTKTVVTGYPVRSTFQTIGREEARASLGLTEADTMILVAGASQGAGAINRSIFAALPNLIEHHFLFHITGTGGIDEAMALRAGLGERLARYEPAAFRSDLPTLMLAADLAIMRAGASVLGELPAAGLPSILVPGTFAGGHQRDNARWLADAGAAKVLEESRLDELCACIMALLSDKELLATMRSAATTWGRPDAAETIASLILEVATK